MSTVNKTLGNGSMIIFTRLLRFYSTFIVVATLVGSLSLAVLTFDEFHRTTSSQARAAEGSLVSSGSTSIISVMLATKLLFHNEGYETATRKDFTLVWVPLITLGWSIVAFLLGLLLWYGTKNDSLVVKIVGAQTFCVGVAFWMWGSMKRVGVLGKKETEANEDKAETAPNKVLT